MPDVSQNPDLYLKVIFLVHYVLSALASIGFWSSAGYVYYNFILILLLLWAIKERNSEQPLQLAIVINSFSIVIDILLLIMGYPHYEYRAREKVTVAIGILHLLVRPLTTVCLTKILHVRGGLAGGGLEGVFSGAHRHGYDDIDEILPTAPTLHTERSGESSA